MSLSELCLDGGGSPQPTLKAADDMLVECT
jgi:hypothetical protein